MTITAETLVAGTAEREIAAVRQDAELGAPDARWRPAVWLDKWEPSPDAYEVRVP
jgi:hypothetical protein